jgi:hypothetical protein
MAVSLVTQQAKQYRPVLLVVPIIAVCERKDEKER